jgi:hypothetical protein
VPRWLVGSALIASLALGIEWALTTSGPAPVLVHFIGGSARGGQRDAGELSHARARWATAARTERPTSRSFHYSRDPRHSPRETN